MRATVCNIDEWASLLHNSPQRPVLTHLNADTSWLLQLPYPAGAARPSGRTHFNVLFDPWLHGAQSDVAWWFSTQWHVVPPAVASIHDLDSLLKKLERRRHGGGDGVLVDNEEAAETRHNGGGSGGSFIDVVIISHEFTDHCHRATLEELPQQTPVFATDAAADLIRTWCYFDNVVTAPGLVEGVHWSRLTVGSLPSWLSIGRVVTPGSALYFHSAVLVAFSLDQLSTTAAATPAAAAAKMSEAIVYSSHGIKSDDLAGLPSSGLTALVLLHGLHDVRIWAAKQLNLGALNGIRAARACGARYWVATHDEVKTSGGFIAPLLRRVRYTLSQAIRDEQARLMASGDEEEPVYTFAELASGDILLLE